MKIWHNQMENIKLVLISILRALRAIFFIPYWAYIIFWVGPVTFYYLACLRNPALREIVNYEICGLSCFDVYFSQEGAEVFNSWLLAVILYMLFRLIKQRVAENADL